MGVRDKVKGVASAAKAKTKETLHKAGDAVARQADKIRPDKDRTQGVIAAHNAVAREVVIASRLVPDHLRILHSSELVMDLYRKEVGVSEDYKGMYYCSYGSSGFSGGIEISVDIAQLLLSNLSPPLGIEISAEAKVEPKGDKVDHLLLMLNRGFPKTPISPLTWKTNQPVCFMTLQGKELGVSIKGSVEAGASLGFEQLSINGHSLSLNLARVQAGIQGGCKFYRLNDPLPGWYSDIMDVNLQSDFAKVASPGKEQLKQQINEWRKHLRAVIFEEHPEHATDQRLDGFRKLLNKRLSIDFSLSRGLKVTPSHEVEIWLRNIRETIERLSRENIISLQQGEPEELEKYLAAAIQAITDAKHDDVQKGAKKVPLPLKSNYQQIMGDLEGYKSKQCFANLTVYSVEGDASAEVGKDLSQAIPLGEIFKTDKVEDVEVASISASAGASIIGNARFMTSRYQTFSRSDNRQRMFLTQDTKITYTQVVGQYSAGAIASLPFDIEVGYAKEGEKVLRNDMNYYSVSTYWLETNPFVNPQLCAGSGISLGTSISLKKLRTIAAKSAISTSPTDPDLAKLIRRYPYYLGLTFQQFINFVKQIGPLITDEMIEEHPFLLIESNFSILNPETIEVIKEGDKLESLIKKFFGKKDRKISRLPQIPLRLESIRCRLRLGTDMDQTRSVFKLGVHVAGIGAGVSIEKVERAGNMFIKDLYVWDAPVQSTFDPNVTPSVAPKTITPDQKVPATVLLPHTFQID